MLSGLTNNKTGLGLGIRASHNGVDDEHCGISCDSNTPVEKPLPLLTGTLQRPFRREGKSIFNTKPETPQHRLVPSLCAH